MTIQEAIGRLDSLMHNTYSDHQKTIWLSEVDGQIQNQLVLTHEGGIEVPLPYKDTDAHRQLLAPHPYDAMYLHYLQAQMHYHNGEFDRYNNAIAMFQAAFDDYSGHFHRTHRPIGGKIRYF